MDELIKITVSMLLAMLAIICLPDIAPGCLDVFPRSPRSEAHLSFSIEKCAKLAWHLWIQFPPKIVIDRIKYLTEGLLSWVSVFDPQRRTPRGRVVPLMLAWTLGIYSWSIREEQGRKFHHIDTLSIVLPLLLMIGCRRVVSRMSDTVLDYIVLGPANFIDPELLFSNNVLGVVNGLLQCIRLRPLSLGTAYLHESVCTDIHLWYRLLLFMGLYYIGNILTPRLLRSVIKEQRWGAKYRVAAALDSIIATHEAELSAKRAAVRLHFQNLRGEDGSEDDIQQWEELEGVDVPADDILHEPGWEDAFEEWPGFRGVTT